MNFLADASWLMRWERELRTRRAGPASMLFEKAPFRVFVNVISHCEFLCGGPTWERRTMLSHISRLPLTYQDSELAAEIRFRRARTGKPISTPDALMAACAINRRAHLLTGDKDFSGIPGLSWSSYRTE